MHFNIDFRPLEQDFRFANDYNSVLIYSAICDPLFKFDGSSIQKYACKEYLVSNDAIMHTFILRNDLFFPDGSKVQAKDYEGSLLKVLKSKSILRFLLENIRTISASKQVLSITLNEPDFHFFKILSKINFSAYKAGTGAGLYYVSSWNNQHISLKINKFHRFYKKSCPSIIFDVVKDAKKDVSSFIDKKTDFTCDTLYSENILNFSSSILHSYASPLQMNLIFSNPKLLLPTYAKIREYIFNGINVENIASNYSSFIKPIQCKRKNINSKLREDINLTLGYNDFYPNKCIAEKIRRNLAELGINITLKRESFENQNTNTDLKLSIVYPDYLDETAMLRSKYMETLFKINTKHYNQFLKLKRKLYKRHISSRVIQKINKLICKDTLIVPLFSLNSIYLSNNHTFSFEKLNYEDLCRDF